MLNSIFYPITSLMYAAFAAYFWRAHQLPAAVPAGPASATRTVENALMLVPLALHAMLLYQSVFADAGMRLGIGNAISTIVWLTVAIYWLGNLFSSRCDVLYWMTQFFRYCFFNFRFSRFFYRC